MSYVQKVLQPDERVIVEGRLHWVMYTAGIAWLVLALVIVLLGWTGLFRSALADTNTSFDPARGRFFLDVLAAPFAAIGLIALIQAKFRQMTTELAVTDRRVIQKFGFISRHTAEMNINQVESVEVEQSLLGRMLDYGTVTIHGTGAGLETLYRLATPLRVRTAITAR